jgi:hypothetical protein
VGELDEKIVASVMVGHDGYRSGLYYLAVSPALQARGLGQAMHAQAVSWLGQQDVWKINLMVCAENKGVMGFHESLGYEVNRVLSLGKYPTGTWNELRQSPAHSRLLIAGFQVPPRGPSTPIGIVVGLQFPSFGLSKVSSSIVITDLSSTAPELLPQRGQNARLEKSEERYSEGFPPAPIHCTTWLGNATHAAVNAPVWRWQIMHEQVCDFSAGPAASKRMAAHGHPPV